MSRGLTVSQVALLQMEGAEVKILIEIDSSPDFTWRFCTGSISAECDGDMYLPRAIAMSVTSSGKISGTHCTLSIDNRDDMSGDVKLTGVNGANVKIILLTVVNDIPQEPIVLEVGDVNRCKISEDLTLDVVPLNRGLKESGLLRCSRMCPYIFGGLLCGHTLIPGEACDRSYPDCVSYSNELRFGGFAWALDAGENILVQQPVTVNPPSASSSGDGYDIECHSGRFVTALYADGHRERIELRCDIESVSNGATGELDGIYTDPWEFHVNEEEQTLL